MKKIVLGFAIVYLAGFIYLVPSSLGRQPPPPPGPRGPGWRPPRPPGPVWRVPPVPLPIPAPRIYPAPVVPAPLVVEPAPVVIIEPPVIAAGKVSVTVAALNVRAGPGYGYAITGKLNQGDILRIKGKSKGWYYVLLPSGGYGWVASQFTAPIISPASG